MIANSRGCLLLRILLRKCFGFCFASGFGSRRHFASQLRRRSAKMIGRHLGIVLQRHGLRIAKPIANGLNRELVEKFGLPIGTSGVRTNGGSFSPQISLTAPCAGVIPMAAF
jgi:hypothetical protein